MYVLGFSFGTDLSQYKPDNSTYIYKYLRLMLVKFRQFSRNKRTSQPMPPKSQERRGVKKKRKENSQQELDSTTHLGWQKNPHSTHRS